ncbi:MAG: sulfotransferase domain-containing protein [Desulfosalsimonadaceae bacterium]
MGYSKELIKYCYRIYKRKGRPKGSVLVASVPRCGSTFLVRALGCFGPGSTCPKTFDCCFVRDLACLPNKKFMKTHSLAPSSIPEDVKVIFLFGDPVAAIVSTYQKRFDHDHFLNCGYHSDSYPDIFNRDDLGYERIFDAWTREGKGYPVLAVRYEKLFDNVNILQDFLECEIDLGKKKSRTTVINPDTARSLSIVYKSLINKVNSFPDVKLLS